MNLNILLLDPFTKVALFSLRGQNSWKFEPQIVTQPRLTGSVVEHTRKVNCNKDLTANDWLRISIVSWTLGAKALFLRKCLESVLIGINTWMTKHT